MGHPADDGWCNCEPPADMPEAQRIGTQFSAQVLGVGLCYGLPPADSMLAWVMARENPTPGDIAAEWDRRGLAFDIDD